MKNEYDIIFAGGGTAACVAASLLASASPSLRILILENGLHTEDVPTHTQPARWIPNVRTLGTPEGHKFTVHTSKNRTKGLGAEGYSPLMSNANCLGGGSGVNGMMYNRAAASDYDDWERFGNPGWGSKDLIPLAKKLETYQAGVVSETHGSSGPIKVSFGGFDTTTGQDLLDAAQKYPRGRGFTDDMMDFSTCNQYGRIPRYVDQDSGRRSDAAYWYIYRNRDKQPNIDIIVRARVIRVLFNADKTATGVEFHNTGEDGEVSTLVAKATRLVVLSAGSFCSPAILERSGIGSAEILEKLEVEVVSALPGVGENYHDHPALFVEFLIPPEQVSVDTLLNEAEGAVLEAQWNSTGKGLVSTKYVSHYHHYSSNQRYSGMDAGIKLRPNAKDLEVLGPAFEERWKTFFVPAPDKWVIHVGTLNARAWSAGGMEAPPASALWCFLAHPVAVGSVHIQSKDAFQKLLVESSMLAREADMVAMRWAYKWLRELVRRMDSFRGEYAPGHPKFPAGSEAACLEMATGPIDVDAPEIRYSNADDEAIDAHLRSRVATVWHALGTCAMKPLAAGGVVDAQLNVYGVHNLKVADMSIAPSNVGPNTNNTALIIGNKTALIIAAELGLEVV